MIACSLNRNLLIGTADDSGGELFQIIHDKCHSTVTDLPTGHEAEADAEM